MKQVGAGLDDVCPGCAGGFEAAAQVLECLFHPRAPIALAAAVAINVAGELASDIGNLAGAADGHDMRTGWLADILTFMPLGWERSISGSLASSSCISSLVWSKTASYQRPLLLTGEPVNGRWHLIDLARSRHANPTRIPVSPSDRRYQLKFMGPA